MTDLQCKRSPPPQGEIFLTEVPLEALGSIPVFEVRLSVCAACELFPRDVQPERDEVQYLGIPVLNFQNLIPNIICRIQFLKKMQVFQRAEC